MILQKDERKQLLVHSRGKASGLTGNFYSSMGRRKKWKRPHAVYLVEGADDSIVFHDMKLLFLLGKMVKINNFIRFNFMHSA